MKKVKIELTERQIWEIVLDWYTNGMYPDVLQDENGLDLEEICEMKLCDLAEEKF